MELQHLIEHDENPEKQKELEEEIEKMADLNTEGDESPIPADPFENKEKLGKLEHTDFNFKENFIATTGVMFSEEALIGPN